MKTLYLVACAKTKQSGTHPAEELYTSPLFRKSVAWVKQQLQGEDQWLILSAKYGAVAPSTPIESYNVSMHDLTAAERSQWSLVAWMLHLAPRLIAPSEERFERVVFLAGWAYQRELIWRMNRHMENCPTRDGWDIEDPLSGMMIGARLRWLTANTKAGAA